MIGILGTIAAVATLIGVVVLLLDATGIFPIDG